MLHTYLDTDLEVTKAKVREPLKRYLQSFINQFRPLMGDAPGDLTSPEIQNLLNLAFDRYFDHNSLLGTPSKCAAMIETVTTVGVDEVACLVDFGLDLQTTLKSLDRLIELRRQFRSKTVR